MRRPALKGEAGIAMVVVLFVAAVLTAVSSAAAFMTIQEFRAARDDRKGAQAFAFAEAGIDRLIMELRRGTLTWADIRQAGCETPALQLRPGNVDPTNGGKYDVELVVFNPNETGTARFPDAACTNQTRTSDPRNPHYFAITSTGQHPAAKRVVRQVIQVGVLNLPVGIYADFVAAAGTPDMVGISLITPGNVTGREFLGFSGIDPYYTLDDFWPGQSATTHVPAGVHALGTIRLKQDTGGGGQENKTEHPPPLNCDANKKGTSGQSQWDQSGGGSTIPAGSQCSNWVAPSSALAGPPPSSLFTKEIHDAVVPKPDLSDQDYFMLRDSAKQTGLYCLIKADATKVCTKAGQSWTPGSNAKGYLRVSGAPPSDTATPPVTQNFVAYFEFETPGGWVSWDGADVVNLQDGSLCSTTYPTKNRSVVAVIDNGNVSIEGETLTNGFFLVPDGKMEVAGNMRHNGTIIAKEFSNQGQATFSMNECWVANMPGPFLDVTPTRWNEVDR